MILLGIETSCDETSVALLKTNQTTHTITEILSQKTATSLTTHAKTGGIIPEIAAREQLMYMMPVLNECLQEGLSVNIDEQIPDIDAICITYGPGLIGSLLVGVETARTLSYVWNKPLIQVNHLYGHIYANWIENHTIQFPAIALVISGGHTDLLLMKSHTEITLLGGTRDDAAGEAFDKIGRLLGLSYPAGPEIEQRAKVGNPKFIHFPRPLIGEKTYDFSFSGLKTAVLREVKTRDNLDEQTINDLCASTQAAIIDVLVKKTLQAAQEYSVQSVILGGGVAANQTLVNSFQQSLHKQKLPAKLFVPIKSLCTDNGAMIAAAGFFRQQNISWQDLSPNPELYF